MALSLFIVPLGSSASARTVQLNSRCSKPDRIVSISGMTLRCTLVEPSKGIWRYQRVTRNASAQNLSHSLVGQPLGTDKPVADGTEGRVATAVYELSPPESSQAVVTTTPATAPIGDAFAPASSSPASQSSGGSTTTNSYPVVPDPANGGSPEVVDVRPETTEQPDPSLPSRVSRFELQSLGDSAVSFVLTPVTGVSNYQVYVRYGDSFTLKSVDGSSPTVTFSDLTADWPYTACAYYFLNSAQSEKSCIDFRTSGTRPVEPVRVAGPTNVTATATETTITVTWSAVANASSYSICHIREDSMQCGGYTMLTETSAIFKDGSISSGWDYTIKIEAVFENGSRSRESQTSVRSLGSRPIPSVKLAGATNFRVVSVTPTTATVTWDYSASSEIRFWSVTARHLTSYSSTGVDPSAREFTIMNLASGLGYEITIQGRTDTNETEVVSTSVLMPNI